MAVLPRRRADTSADVSSSPPSLLRPSSSPLRRLMLLLALLLSSSLLFTLVGAISSACPSLEDPYPSSFRSIATSETTQALVYSYLGSVRLYDRSSPSTSSAFTSPQPACRTVTVPSSHINSGESMPAIPLFAKTLATHQNVLAVGNPNRDLSMSSSPSSPGGAATYRGVAYSSIDILALTGTTVTSVSTIEDFNSPLLGSLTSMATDALSLASLYNAQTIVVYSPLKSRKISYFNSGGGTSNDVDSKISISATFSIDSLSLRGQTLAVSGFELQGLSCFPAVQIWTQAGAPNAGGAWTKTSSFNLRRVTAAADFSNAHPCPSRLGLPSGALPLALSEDLSSLVVGAPKLSTVWFDSLANFVALTPRFVFDANRDQAKGGFGAHVDFASPAGDEFHVFSESDNSIYSYHRAVWAAKADLPAATFSSKLVAEFAHNVLPNRRQQRLTDSGHASFVQFASSPSALYVLTKPNLASARSGGVVASPIFALPNTPLGQTYDTESDSIVDCPVGMYKADTSNDACSLCSAGRYAATTGSSSCSLCNTSTAADGTPYYCPTGSTGRLTSEIYQAESPEYLLPFDAQGAGELFEELLVNTVFTRYSKPMIAFYVLMFSTLGLIFVFWFPYTPQHIKNRTLGILLLYQFVSLPNEKENARVQLEKKMKKHLDAFPTGHGAAGAGAAAVGAAGAGDASPLDHEKAAAGLRNRSNAGSKLALITAGSHSRLALANGGGEYAHHRVPSGTVAPNFGRALSTAEMRIAALKDDEVIDDELEELLEHERHADHIVCAGFFKLVLIMFCFSAILFSIIFLSSYDWRAVHAHGDTPINRYTYEEVKALTSAEDATQRGLEVLALTNTTFSIDLFGFTGAPCTKSTVLSLKLAGCSVLHSPLLCNDSSFIAVSANNAAKIPSALQSNVCSFQLNVPRPSSFVAPLVFSLSLPANVHVSAARYSYLQNAELAPSEDDRKHYEIAATEFRETVTHPYTATKDPATGLTSSIDLSDNYLASPVVRNWNLGTLINRHQDTEDTPIHFYAHLFNTISVTSLNPFFSTYSAEQYNRDSSSTSLEFHIIITQDSFVRVQSSQRLIQPGVAFLTIVLGLIGIYHMILFGQEMCELAWFAFKKARTYTHHATNKVVAMSEDFFKSSQTEGKEEEEGGDGGPKSPSGTGATAMGAGASKAGGGVHNKSAAENEVHAVGKIDEEDETGPAANTSRSSGAAAASKGGPRVVDSNSSSSNLLSGVNHDGTLSTRRPAAVTVIPAPANSTPYLHDNGHHPLGLESPPNSAGPVNQMQQIELQPSSAAASSTFLSPSSAGANGAAESSPSPSPDPSDDEVKPILSSMHSRDTAAAAAAHAEGPHRLPPVQAPAPGTASGSAAKSSWAAKKTAATAAKKHGNQTASSAPTAATATATASH